MTKSNDYTDSEFEKKLTEKSVAVKHPELLLEWNYEKNLPLTPENTSSGSNKTVWWKCCYGHEWRSKIGNRTFLGRGCPYCAGRYAIKGVNDLQTLYPDLSSEWHPVKNGDLLPSDVKAYTNRKVWWKCLRGHEWQATVGSRVSGSGCPYCSSAGSSLPEQGIAFYLEQICKVEQRVKILKQEIDVYLPDYKIGIEYDGRFYHNEKNAHKEQIKNEILSEAEISLIRIKESDTNKVSGLVISYKMDVLGQNYEWALNELRKLLVSLTGNERFNLITINVQNDLLKIRERLRLYYKENSLAVKNPDLAKEWNYEKNGILEPQMFSSKNSTKVWWICSKGHEWQAVIGSRMSGKGCPYCSNHSVLTGFNDLQTIHPEIAEEWNYEKNGDLIPSAVTYGSHIKVWWKCKRCNYEWQTQVSNRVNGHICPVCARIRVVEEKSSLAFWSKNNNPELINEWNYEKNTDNTPNDVSYASSKKVWWICSKGHEWQAEIEHRTLLGQGCPYCYRIRLSKRVRNIDTNEIFDGLEIAAKSCGLKRGYHISECCKGKRKTAGGYHWEFVD